MEYTIRKYILFTFHNKVIQELVYYLEKYCIDDFEQILKFILCWIYKIRKFYISRKFYKYKLFEIF